MADRLIQPPMPWEQRTTSFLPIEDHTEETETVTQPSKQPTQKVGLGVGLGGGFILGIQLWLRERFGINLLDVEVGLLTWLFTLGAAYYVKERKATRTP